MNLLTTSIIDHFERTLDMFRVAVKSFPEVEWTKGEMDYLRPAGTSYHLIETIQFYASDIQADKYPWGDRFGCDWEDPDASKLPSQDDIIKYLEETWQTSKNWITSKDLTTPETIYPWTGEVLSSRLLYLLRHTQHHIAEMNLELKRRGYSFLEWK